MGKAAMASVTVSKRAHERLETLVYTGAFVFTSARGFCKLRDPAGAEPPSAQVARLTLAHVNPRVLLPLVIALCEKLAATFETQGALQSRRMGTLTKVKTAGPRHVMRGRLSRRILGRRQILVVTQRLSWALLDARLPSTTSLGTRCYCHASNLPGASPRQHCGRHIIAQDRRAATLRGVTWPQWLWRRQPLWLLQRHVAPDYGVPCCDLAPLCCGTQLRWRSAHGGPQGRARARWRVPSWGWAPWIPLTSLMAGAPLWVTSASRPTPPGCATTCGGRGRGLHVRGPFGAAPSCASRSPCTASPGTLRCCICGCRRWAP
mmetsp:Transcript_12584/g.37839  ORF Transcript_12584/g.37839 Transcript_12584/m.37839 type:complete len:319 (-) Transcript_12584:1344-2300(-)